MQLSSQDKHNSSNESFIFKILSSTYFLLEKYTTYYYDSHLPKQNKTIKHQKLLLLTITSTHQSTCSYHASLSMLVNLCNHQSITNFFEINLPWFHRWEKPCNRQELNKVTDSTLHDVHCLIVVHSVYVFIFICLFHYKLFAFESFILCDFLSSGSI